MENEQFYTNNRDKYHCYCNSHSIWDASYNIVKINDNWDYMVDAQMLCIWNFKMFRYLQIKHNLNLVTTEYININHLNFENINLFLRDYFNNQTIILTQLEKYQRLTKIGETIRFRFVVNDLDTSTHRYNPIKNKYN